MKDELQTKLVEILSSIQSATGKASDFAMEQLPEIAQSYVLYGRIEATFWTLALSALAVACVIVAVRFGFADREAVYKGGYSDGEWFARRIIVSVFGTIASVVVSASALHSVTAFLLVWFAPKVWLLKEIASLVK